MSNRQERRARARSPHTMHVPDGQLVRADILTPTGEVQEVTNWRQLPAKQPGVHRWCAVMSHYLTASQADAWHNRTEASPVLLDASSVMFAEVGCIDCEESYDEAHGRPCAAVDDWPES